MSDTGRLVWYEHLTTDPAAAIAFYTDVAGWTTRRWDAADYTMFVGGQGPLGGVTLLPEAARQLGARPYWQANVVVPDVDAACARIEQLGGKVYLAETVPTIGRLAVIADPQGAVLAIFTPEQPMPPRDPTQVGEVSWHELYTTDHEAAFEFYRELVGWERLGSFDMGPMGQYLLWGRNGTQLGGMLTMPPGMKAPDGAAIPPNWLCYITVADLEAALARARGRGATVLHGPMEVPTGQRIVQLLDPNGAAIALTTPPLN